ncbi:hypothetical protein VD0002_g9824 [Verticillium dahliae]|uniref:Uncharacterized protein n=1 Tax=Verticillium dahliae TaxID=27337 RepID=A0AA44WRD4_VERDA|nr:hypothetical protein BJF96_g571 [Verticillium dahliae]PNH41246.1 hypothetical protein VD0003_g9991 [Verticillium dahliae]PNH56189.1 hypothetical protein VD0002_g9824 [Verticillium dahliae]
MAYTMKLSKERWDKCIDRVSSLPEHTGTFVSEAYDYFLTLHEQDMVYFTNCEPEKLYYELWDELLGRILRNGNHVLKNIENLCQVAPIPLLEADEKNFGILGGYLEVMIKTIDHCLAN